MAISPGKCLLPQLLHDKGLSPYDVYSKLGISKQQFSDYYTGRRKMSLGTAKAMANVLGVTIDDLYTWLETPPRRKGSRTSSE